jgi:hypothetical protein
MWRYFAGSSGILCRQVFVILTVHRDEKRIFTERKTGGIFLHNAPLNVPACKINSCLTNCLVDFVNQSFLTWVQMQQFYCSSCWRWTHIRVRFMSKERFCWIRPRFTINFIQFCLIYHPSSACSLSASNGGYCSKMFTYLKPFFKVCTRKFCSRFTATLSVGSVFSKCILQKHATLQRYSHSDCRMAERLET